MNKQIQYPRLASHREDQVFATIRDFYLRLTPTAQQQFKRSLRELEYVEDVFSEAAPGFPVAELRIYGTDECSVLTCLDPDRLYAAAMTWDAGQLYCPDEGHRSHSLWLIFRRISSCLTGVITVAWAAQFGPLGLGLGLLGVGSWMLVHGLWQDIEPEASTPWLVLAAMGIGSLNIAMFAGSWWIQILAPVVTVASAIGTLLLLSFSARKPLMSAAIGFLIVASAIVVLDFTVGQV